MTAHGETRLVRGPRQYVSGDRQEHAEARFDDMLAARQRTGTHLWIAVVAHFIDPPIRDGTIFDVDSLIGPPTVGCYICEQLWEPRLRHRRCPGETPGGAA